MTLFGQHAACLSHAQLFQMLGKRDSHIPLKYFRPILLRVAKETGKLYYRDAFVEVLG